MSRVRNAFVIFATFFIGGGVFTYFRDHDHQVQDQVHAGYPQPFNAIVDTKKESPVKEPSDDSDMPVLKKLRKEGVSYQLADHDVLKMTANERALTMHSILDNTDTICRRKLRMGNLGDGGWEICDDSDVRPIRPCIVYSFGINYGFSFDDDTAATYGCHVYSFDPSMKKANASYDRSANVHFYKIGIFGVTETRANGWKLYTFSDIRKLLGHENTRIDVVKMDVENSEWSAVRDMIDSGEMKKINQFLIEFHTHNSKPAALNLIRDIEKQGFKKFYVSKNTNCGTRVTGFPVKRTTCYEVHYVRRP